jgi:putative oxidoreductase
MLFSSDVATNRGSAGLLILRLSLGATFIAHGYQKLFVFGIGGVAEMLTHMGFPASGFLAPLVAGVEFFGGIAIVLGLLTRLFGLALAIEMLVAVLVVKLKGGFFAPKGAEFEIALFAASAALALIGAGVYSIDFAIARRRVA